MEILKLKKTVEKILDQNKAKHIVTINLKGNYNNYSKITIQMIVSSC